MTLLGLAYFLNCDHLCLCLFEFEFESVPSGKFLHGSRLCKSCLVTLHASGFMSKTLLSKLSNLVPIKASSSVLLS